MTKPVIYRIDKYSVSKSHIEHKAQFLPVKKFPALTETLDFIIALMDFIGLQNGVFP